MQPARLTKPVTGFLLVTIKKDDTFLPFSHLIYPLNLTKRVKTLWVRKRRWRLVCGSCSLFVKERKKTSAAATLSNDIKKRPAWTNAGAILNPNLGRVKFEWIAFIFQTSFASVLKEQSVILYTRSADQQRPSAPQPAPQTVFFTN